MRAPPPPSHHHPSRLVEGTTAMLDLITGRTTDCTGVTRREFLRVGGLSALGLSLPGFLRLQHLAAAAGQDPKNGSHGVADHLMMSGHKFNAAMAFPCYGSVVAKERGYQQGMFPFVQLGRYIDRRFNGGVAGFLGDQYNPFEVGDDPNSPGFRVRDLSLASAADQSRLERRYSMLTDLEHYQK